MRCRIFSAESVIVTEGDFNVNIRFLFTLFGYDETRLRKALDNKPEWRNGCMFRSRTLAKCVT